MDVLEVPDVGNDGHAGVGHCLCRRLRLPELTDYLRIATVVVGCNLDIVEREITLAPHLTPAANQGLHVFRIQHPLGAVRLALIPDRSAQGEGLQWMDHP